MKYSPDSLKKFKALIDKSQRILMLQPERIDPDSVGSALALTQLVADQGKSVSNYIDRPMPAEMAYFPNLKLFSTQMPANFDITILVDCGGPTQLTSIFKKHLDALSAKPFVIIDHHANREPMPFPTLDLIDASAASSGQQVVELAEHFGWKLSADSAYSIAASIKSDTLDLSVESVSPRTFAVMGKLVELGADLEELRIKAEQSFGLPPKLLPLKAEVLKRTTLHHQNRVAISYLTLEEFSRLGPDSVIDEQVKHELRQLKGIKVAALVSERAPGDFKVSMRANIPVAGPLASALGGGGHDKAASYFLKAKDVKTAVETAARQIVKATQDYEAL